MNRSKWIVLALTLGLMAGTAGILVWLKIHQRLGPPGLKHKPIPNSVVVELDLPARVGEFDSTNMAQAQVVLDYLPKDTSFAQRHYFAPDGFWVNGNVILMGADRTSIHKPDYCLPGQGWRIETRVEDKIPVRDGAAGYELPVSKWTLRNFIKTPDGSQAEVSGLYIFWFVTKGDQTPKHLGFMRNLAWHLLSTGELQRWAYVSYFALCAPGREEAALERMKKLIASSVPEFQLPPKSVAGRPVVGQP